MNRLMKKLNANYLFLLLPIMAYILPGPFLISKVAEWRGKLKIHTLEVHSEATLFSKGKEIGQGTILEYYRAPYERREERQIERRKEITLWKGVKKYVRGEGGQWKESETRMQPEQILLVGTPKDSELTKSLERLGIDLKQRRLDRLQGKVCVVVGSEKPEDKQPELWLDHKTFKPLRFIDYSEAEGKPLLVDTRFTDYSSSVSGEWFPRLIEKYINGALTERREIIEIKVNPTLDKALFETK